MHTPHRLAPKVIVVALAVGLLALAAILLTPSPAPAQPVISWTPGSVTQTILAGESATVPVSFTATENLTNVVVRAVPELAPYVQTNPTSFASIVKGQPVNLNLTISAPADALPKVVDGVIQIRSGAGAPRIFAQPLGAKVEVWAVVTEKGLKLGYPSSWQRNPKLNESNNPIELNTFNSNYGQGSVIPKDGAVMTILKTALSINDAISKDSVENTVQSIDTVSVNGTSATRVIYKIPFKPLFTYSNIIVYVPKNNSLYKFSLLYRDGTARESEFLSDFQGILNTVQFIQ